MAIRVSAHRVTDVVPLGYSIQSGNPATVNRCDAVFVELVKQTISDILLIAMYANYLILRNILLVYAALLPIVNPFGMAPIFAVHALGYDMAIRRTVAMRVAVNGFVLLMASLFVGSYVLDFFGVSIGAVQMGGGLIVMISGWRILNQQSNVSDRTMVPRPAARRYCRRRSIR